MNNEKMTIVYLPLIFLVIGYCGSWVFQRSSTDPIGLKNWRSTLFGVALGALTSSLQVSISFDEVKNSIASIARNTSLDEFVTTLNDAYNSHKLLGEIYRLHVSRNPGHTSEAINLAKRGVYEVTKEELPRVAIMLVDYARSTISATSFVSEDQWWRTSWGKEYLNANMRAIKERRVSVERTFVFPDRQTFQRCKSILDDNVAAGVTVMYTFSSDLGEQFVHDVILIDDRFVGILDLEGREIRKITFSVAPEQMDLVHQTLRIAGAGAVKYH